MKKFLALIFFILLIPSICFANPGEILNSMTLEQKIGQLFLIKPDALNMSLSLE